MKEIGFKTEQRKVKELLPYEHNPRKITAKMAEKLRESLEKFGLAEIPVVNTDNTLVAGHQRVKVLMLLGRGDEVIDVRVPNRKLTQKELQEYNIKSNKIQGIWDDDILANGFELDDLLSWGFEENELGFDAYVTDKKDDDVPEVPETPKSKQGDLYILGNHRLLCGDSTKKEDVELLMGGHGQTWFSLIRHTTSIIQGEVKKHQTQSRMTIWKR